jgi:predicted amidohydrolase
VTFASPLARDHAAPESTLALVKATCLALRAIATSALVLAAQETGNVTGHATRVCGVTAVVDGRG